MAKSLFLEPVKSILCYAYLLLKSIILDIPIYPMKHHETGFVDARKVPPICFESSCPPN